MDTSCNSSTSQAISGTEPSSMTRKTLEKPPRLLQSKKIQEAGAGCNPLKEKLGNYISGRPPPLLITHGIGASTGVETKKQSEDCVGREKTSRSCRPRRERVLRSGNNLSDVRL
ncbi:hypothetical protein B296_00014601 [Ensete ventricosum]|uniref:Uncharacterized protein n=1 Tax=Ensete ventricosum TaxID=4639 RepID=A0A427B265_ENSVE|nr:hypothetical protein B296_00014601 [Ensete ventricosum]